MNVLPRYIYDVLYKKIIDTAGLPTHDKAELKPIFLKFLEEGLPLNLLIERVSEFLNLSWEAANELVRETLGMDGPGGASGVETIAAPRSEPEENSDFRP